MGDWRKRAKSHRGLLGKGFDFLIRRRESFETEKVASQSLSRKPMIHIGVDFGTSWTKVAYRVLQSNRLGVLPYSSDIAFQKDEGEVTSFARSVIYYKTKGEFRVADFFGSNIISCTDGESAMTEFKMNFNSKIANERINLGALFYLSQVLRYAKNYIVTTLELVGMEDQIEWGATLGIPTDYINSPIERRNLQLLEQAWYLSDSWSENSISEEWLKNWANTVREYHGDFHVMPELQASIFSLTHDTKFPEGIFSLFDVGGGTLDGSVFHFTRSSSGRKINVLRTQVINSGVEKIIERILREAAENSIKIGYDEVHRELMNGHFADYPIFNSKTRNSITQPIVEMTAKIATESKRALPTLEQWNKSELPFLYGGGGASFRWFRDTIEVTFSKNDLIRCGLPKFKGKEIPIPDENDFSLNALDTSSIKRFLVAYGLSYPYYEHDQVIAFPDHNPIVKRTVGSRKDPLYDRQLNGYGEVD